MRTTMLALAQLVSRPDVLRLPWGAFAVPHATHRTGFVHSGSTAGERAIVMDAGTFVHVSCGCGATPYEIAAELGVAPELLQPFASEQATMLKLQRDLRRDRDDERARELLCLKGIAYAQAMAWRPSDAGWPVELWGLQLCDEYSADTPSSDRSHAEECSRKPNTFADDFSHGGSPGAGT